jgi:drug/metabolite transporter (DMT)-like permease
MSIPLAYLGVILIWSTTPLAVQWSTQGVGFAFAICARMAIGLVLATTVIVIGRIGFPLHARARRSYLAGGLGLFGTMSLIYWGARFIHSGLISVLFGLSPLFTALMASRWLGERALTPSRLIGMAVGLAGLATIFAQGDGAGGERATQGLVALLLAVIVYSASLVWVKRVGDDSPPLATTAGTLVVALPLFVLLWWATDGRWPSAVPSRTLAAIAYLGVFGTVLGFALYYYVIRHMAATRVALITLITPVSALLLGQALNGESISPRVWLGAVLITGGLVLHQWRDWLRAVGR